MVPSRRARWLLASSLGHVGVFALLSTLPASVAAPTTTTAWRVSEFTVEAPPAPEAPRPPAPTEPAPVDEHPTPTASARPAARSRAIAVAPTTVAPTIAPTPVAPTPTVVTPPAPPAPLRATDLLHPNADHFAMPIGPAPQRASTEGRAALFTGSTGSEAERARAATQGFVHDALAATMVREAPGVRTYLWGVRRRVAEAWRPSAARVPDLADTLMAGFIAPERAMRIFGERMIRRQRQVLEAPQPRLNGAADTIEAMGGVSGQGINSNRPPLPTNTGDESWRRNVRTTRVEVQVDQNEAGHVLDVRVLHASGIPAFDRAALEAVRHGIDEQDPATLPGGRRSRWTFTVVATRRLFMPSIGGAFDESRGWFRIEVPGQVTLRSRVQMEESAPLPAATP